MAGRSLREALERRLGSLPVMEWNNGYRVQALPKSELLDLLKMHPEPAGLVVTDDAVEAAAHSLYQSDAQGPWEHGELDLLLAYRDAARAALGAAVPFLQGSDGDA